MIGNKKTTDALEEILTASGAQPAEDILEEYAGKMITEERPFTAYVRERLREKGIQQKELFIKANISERMGRRLISGEKHTTDRDIILRICIAGKFSVDETQRALKLYGMAPLYVKLPRDAVIMHAVAHERRDLWDLDEQLMSNGMERLMKDGDEQ